MTAYLVVVARGNLRAYERLLFFADGARLTVLWDRRRHERRRRPHPVAAEHRRRERRRPVAPSWTTHGYVLIRR